jgi:uncharacterized protein
MQTPNTIWRECISKGRTSKRTAERGSGGLFLAADKGAPPSAGTARSEAFSGREGFQPQRARGLMWLTLAREAAIDSKKDKWIIDLYEKAVASANDEDRQDALAYLEDHVKRRN